MFLVEVRKVISRTVTFGFQRTVKGTGAGRPNVVLNIEPVGERNSMAEQRAFSAICEEKVFRSFGKGGRQLRRTTEPLSSFAGSKLKGLKPNWNSIWLAWQKAIKDAFVSTSTAKGGLRRISILYWM